MDRRTDYLLRLVREALAGLDGDPRLSDVTRKAARIARLRADTDNLYWLEQEMIPWGGVRAGEARLIEELAPSYTREALAELERRALQRYKELRALPNETAKNGSRGVPMFCGASVLVIEEMLTELTSVLATPGLAGTEDARSRARLALKDLRVVKERLVHRLHTHLSQVETELLQRRYTADIFERNKQYVHEQLRTVSPQALEQLIAAAERIEDGGTEALSHALTSCRRCLKSFADSVYPTRASPVIGFDGKPRMLTDAMFVARLWQFVFEHMRNSTSRDMMLDLVGDQSATPG